MGVRVRVCGGGHVRSAVGWEPPQNPTSDAPCGVLRRACHHHAVLYRHFCKHAWLSCGCFLELRRCACGAAPSLRLCGCTMGQESSACVCMQPVRGGGWSRHLGRAAGCRGGGPQAARTACASPMPVPCMCRARGHAGRRSIACPVGVGGSVCGSCCVSLVCTLPGLSCCGSLQAPSGLVLVCRPAQLTDTAAAAVLSCCTMHHARGC